MTISLREPGALQLKTREDYGKNHGLPPLPLGKGSVPKVVAIVKPRVKDLTITHITIDKEKE